MKRRTGRERGTDLTKTGLNEQEWNAVSKYSWLLWMFHFWTKIG